MDQGDDVLDTRVRQSRDAWRRTRRNLNAIRPSLTQLATTLYEPGVRLAHTGLINSPRWLPTEPVDLAAIKLDYQPQATPPDLDGTEAESSNVQPRATLMRRYQRYTQAIRDLDRPPLFDNRTCWRLLDLEWDGAAGSMAFGPTSYFAGVDIHEVLAHELAYCHLDNDGTIRPRPAAMRDLPFRRLVGDPFQFARRPILPAISTLTIRRDHDEASFLLHRRDPRRVAVAGGMLHVIPSGIFQPSSVLPDIANGDFDLWRNIMREYSEEPLGNPEHDGDGRLVQYDAEPFASLNQARDEGRITVHCVGVALDALTLFGEIMTVLVIDGDTFDHMAADFVDSNDEGTVISARVPFTEAGVTSILENGKIAPAGAGCISLAWQHRDYLLSTAGTPAR
jgi:hypothetical protein